MDIDEPAEGDRADYIMSRAEHHVKGGDIYKAALELNQLKGAARETATPWLEDVSVRKLCAPPKASYTQYAQSRWRFLC